MATNFEIPQLRKAQLPGKTMTVPDRDSGPGFSVVTNIVSVGNTLSILM